MKTIQILFISLCVLGLGACSSKPKKVALCQEPDWYEIGRIQGAQGVPLKDAQMNELSCPGSDEDLQKALFTNGHYRGLIEYCSPANGYDLGKSGQSYRKVCPESLAPIFERNYLSGAKALQLEQRNQDIDQEISTLFEELAKTSESESQESQKLKTKINNLRQNRAQNNRELNSLESSQTR